MNKINMNKTNWALETSGKSSGKDAVSLFFMEEIFRMLLLRGFGAVLIWGLQQYLRPVCMNEVTFACLFLQVV